MFSFIIIFNRRSALAAAGWSRKPGWNYATPGSLAAMPDRQVGNG
jgi:hypothetical protein